MRGADRTGRRPRRGARARTRAGVRARAHGRARRFPRSWPGTAAVLLVLLELLFAVSGCGYGSRRTEAAAPAGAAASGPPLSADTVTLGYFANLTHATPLVGIQKGFFAAELGGTRLRTQVFNGGPAAMEALNAGAVDMAWMGPSPTVNGYLRSGGRSLRIVSGSASGGVSLVVDPAKTRGGDGTDIRGLRIATPELGNTQDVALLRWIGEQGWKTDPRTGRGDVTLLRQSTKEIPTSFRRGAVDGAWVPEPVAAQLVAAGGRVVLDEADLWDGGEFVTTHMVVSQSFLDRHRDVVEAVLRGSVRTNAWINAHQEEASTTANDAIRHLTGKPLEPEVLRAAWKHVTVLDDPLALSLREQAGHALALGLLDSADLSGGPSADLRGIYDLGPLNRILTREGRPKADDAGLGTGDHYTGSDAEGSGSGDAASGSGADAP
ncbi:ABC transporter substrate-binding protein [Streptomyces sp. GC420]|uniref:ABC transporter substrate-binding protein n=1 Tax=Streptomyces sp. GC420 TaxID=2697568 RepID=UPI001414D1CD|nr:ABC transporter substrate-binding protein [Streptomyces sp. GC420]NBM20218.1 ABC transporter substrate-binding protein [Streptomyces sp. GC420]